MSTFFEFFETSPVIYCMLLTMAVASPIIWLYGLYVLRLSNMMPEALVEEVRNLLIKKRHNKAIAVCRRDTAFIAPILAKGIEAKTNDPEHIFEILRSESRFRETQVSGSLEYLNEIARVSPLLGLIGTFLIIFFKFEVLFNDLQFFTPFLSHFVLCLGPVIFSCVVSLLSRALYITLENRLLHIINTILNESLTIVKIEVE